MTIVAAIIGNVGDGRHISELRAVILLEGGFFEGRGISIAVFFVLLRNVVVASLDLLIQFAINFLIAVVARYGLLGHIVTSTGIGTHLNLSVPLFLALVTISSNHIGSLMLTC